jgi:hypothetical protein
MKSTKLSSPMKAKCKSTIRAVCQSFAGMVCAGAILLFASSAQGQILVNNLQNLSGNLFEADYFSGNIYEFTPSGAQSTFASGLAPLALAFNSAGDLFEGNWSTGKIYEFSPTGGQSTFASGLSYL